MLLLRAWCCWGPRGRSKPTRRDHESGEHAMSLFCGHLRQHMCVGCLRRDTHVLKKLRREGRESSKHERKRRAREERGMEGREGEGNQHRHCHPNKTKPTHTNRRVVCGDERQALFEDVVYHTRSHRTVKSGGGIVRYGGRRFFNHSCSDGVNMTETQNPAPVCDRGAVGSDPVHTGLPPIRGPSENTFHVLHLPQRRTPGPIPSTRAHNLLDLSRGKQLSRSRGDCTVDSSHHFSNCTIHEFLV